MIHELLEKSRQTMETLPAAEYFANLLKLIRRYALPQEGEILFSQRDLDRLPSGFEQELAQALPAGGSLKVSREPRKIDGGFVLVYGGVEQNCSFAALFDAAKDRLQDKLHALLFCRRAGMMAEKYYAYAVARIRTKELGLLKGAFLEQLLAAKSYEECIQLLSEKGWGDGTTMDAEQILRGEEEKTWALLEDLVDDLFGL